jgi:hypothetical protein
MLLYTIISRISVVIFDNLARIIILVNAFRPIDSSFLNTFLLSNSSFKSAFLSASQISINEPRLFAISVKTSFGSALAIC